MVQNGFPRNRSTIEKWHTKLLFRYLNSRTIPIYQWIPPSHPQVYRWCSHIGVSLIFFALQGLGTMRERIDLDFEVTRDPYTRLAKIRWKVVVSIFFLLKNRSWIFFRHRALFLIRPTIDMSGVYTCKVTNNDVGDDEDDYDSHWWWQNWLIHVSWLFDCIVASHWPCKFHFF